MVINDNPYRQEYIYFETDLRRCYFQRREKNTMPMQYELSRQM